VLGFPVRRPGTNRASLRSSSALRRRLVVGVLTLLALALITLSFGESEDGPMHSVEEAASTVIRPFQVAAERVASPFRDAYGWTSDLIDAKGEAERLRRENQVLEQQLIQNESALRELVQLRALFEYARGPEFPTDYSYKAAAVVAHQPYAFRRQIVVAVGVNDGVELNAPVVTNDGLVGQVTRIFSNRARVTLITDEQSAVAAIDLRSDARGIVSHGRGTGDTLILDFVSKKEVVKEGDEVITAGSTTAELASLYPRGIRIGEVTSVGQTDTDPYKQVQIEPYVDLSALHSVLVLIPKNEQVSGP
jgi:rod shape-determining protein MreC